MSKARQIRRARARAHKLATYQSPAEKFGKWLEKIFPSLKRRHRYTSTKGGRRYG